jgi:diacylglycerol kinase family enzyme
MTAGSLLSSPRSFTNDQVIRSSADGAASISACDGGTFLTLLDSKAKKSYQIRIDDIYGVFRNGFELKLECCPRVTSRKKWFFSKPVYPPKNQYARVCQTRVLSLCNDMEAEEWCAHIRREIRPAYVAPLVEGGAPRKLLVVVNPIGGEGKGEEMFHTILKPMLNDAGVDFELIVTKGPGHAEEVAETFDIAHIGAVAIIGGDGLFGEFLNGLNQRDDRKEALAIPLGVVPAGSSNCIACSIGLRQPLAACFAIVRGKLKAMDVLKVTLGGENPRVLLSMCGVSYGFVSEVNTHAAKWRGVFGPARYTVCGLRTIMSSPMEYHVDCRYISPADESDPEFDKTECGPDCHACDRTTVHRRLLKAEKDSIMPNPPDPMYVKEGTSSGRVDNLKEEWIESSISLDPRRRGLTSSKHIDSSTLLLFSVTNLAIRQSQNHTVWNPHSHMASGHMDLVLMPPLSLGQMLKFLNNYNKRGHQEDSNVFSIIKARSVEMRITNADSLPNWEREIKIAIDGEIYPLQPLRVDTLPGFINFMCS